MLEKLRDWGVFLPVMKLAFMGKPAYVVQLFKCLNGKIPLVSIF